MTTPVTGTSVRGHGGHIHFTSKMNLSLELRTAEVCVWPIHNSENGLGPLGGTLELLIGWLTCFFEGFVFHECSVRF